MIEIRKNTLELITESTDQETTRARECLYRTHSPLFPPLPRPPRGSVDPDPPPAAVRCNAPASSCAPLRITGIRRGRRDRPREVLAVSADTGGDADTKQQRLAGFLRERARTGEYYFKSKFIADEIGLSPKEIGVLMCQLQESVQDLHIEKWSNSRATTWRVEVQ